MPYNYYESNYLGEKFESLLASSIGALIWVIIALVLSLVGCFLIYFMFIKKDNKLENKKLAWLRSFLKFDKMLIETILKISYIFIALFITLGSFAFFAYGFGGFLTCLLVIVFGNLIARIIYEGALIIVMIWKNTTEIKNKLK